MLRTLALLLALTSPCLAAAQSASDAVSISVIPGWRASPDHHIAGIKISLAPGWKTYWRVPGDAGIPPEMTLDDSQGIKALELQWPVPEAFQLSGMQSIGYKDTVILPLHLVVEGGDLSLTGALDIGVCKEVCIPVNIPLQAVLPATGSRDAGLAAALLDRPMNAAEAGAGPVRCRFTPKGHGFGLDLAMNLPSMGGQETVVVELSRYDIWVAESAPVRQGSTLTTHAELLLPPRQPAAIDRSSIRFTVIGNKGAVELQGCAS